MSAVKKGDKIGKLPTPTRSGYTFKAWYTKQSAGTKISKSTIMKKNVVYYAKWKKGSSSTSRVLTAEEQKFVGTWSAGPYLKISNSNRWIEFKKDGTFKRENSNIGKVGAVEGYFYSSGKWKIVGKKIVCTNIKETWLRKPGTGNYVGNYKNKPKADETWSYYFSHTDDTSWLNPHPEGINWLNINHYPKVNNWFVQYAKSIWAN